MSIKKNMAKLQKGRALIQQGQQGAHMAKQAAGLLGGAGARGLPIQGIAGPVASGGLGGAGTSRLPVQGIAGP
ncbi:hypothetical protein PSI22_03715, partial [Xenorhabdus sp. XENO-7]